MSTVAGAIPLRFQMLGPLRVWDGAGWSAVRADHQRVVLAVLLIEAGRAVSSERLIGEIWGEDPPRSALSVVQGYVMRLRRLLGPGLLVTRGRAYELVVGDGELDTHTFDRLVAGGRERLAANDARAATTDFAEALALWRGPALADVPTGATVAAHTARLEQERLRVAEERLGALLDLGQHADVIEELRHLAAEHPLRERLWEHLMVALYRCGRRAEALDSYRLARRALISELGVEPGGQLRKLQRAILADDQELYGGPSLDAAAVHGVSLTPAGPPTAATTAAKVAATTTTATTTTATTTTTTTTTNATTAATVGPAVVGTVVPAQLPADVAGFTGRAAQLARLDALLAGDAAPALAVATIDGTAGVGKPNPGI